MRSFMKARPQLDISQTRIHTHRHSHTYVRLKFERYSFVSVASVALLRLDEWRMVVTRSVCVFVCVLVKPLGARIRVCVYLHMYL